MKKRKFEEWQFEQIQIEFGYQRHYKNFPLLDTWLTCQEPVTESELARLETLRERLFYRAEAWNEDELKLMFISQLLDLVNFYGEQYQIFSQRDLAAVIDEWHIHGIVDLLVSKGIQQPSQPFFFIHEYKQEQKRDNDPLGQLLIAMIVAQQKNQAQMPLFGCYIIGRFYFFVVLEGKNYAVSDALTATSQDIIQIFCMFRYVKRKIEGFLQI